MGVPRLEFDDGDDDDDNARKPCAFSARAKFSRSAAFRALCLLVQLFDSCMEQLGTPTVSPQLRRFSSAMALVLRSSLDTRYVFFH